MRLSFHGAAREVTGSCHLLCAGSQRILLDCGMIQGGRERHVRNRAPFPFSPADLDCVILSHAHIDHSGRLPLLVKAGYRGPILTTPASGSLCRILLADAGRIQEEDARWKVKRLKKRGEDTSWVQPLFTEEEGLRVLEQLVAVPFDHTHELQGNTLRFHKAGHILGAAIVEITVTGKSERRVVFSGDLGVEGARLLSRPSPVSCPDYLLIESTYGDRRRDEEGDRTEQLLRIIERTVNRNGKVIIPAFAVGRTQEVLARVNDLVESGRLSGLAVYVDSPMAVAATQVFAQYPEAYSESAQRSLHAGDKPLEFDGLQLTTSVEESIAINESKEPAIIISASGMCTAGRIKHHLKHNISSERNTLLFVGYQARGSLGRLIQSGVSPVRIFGDWYDVKASVETMDGFSAHADLDELLEWFGSLSGVPKRTFIVHGEESAALHFADVLTTDFGANVEVPTLGREFVLD